MKFSHILFSFTLIFYERCIRNKFNGYINNDSNTITSKQSSLKTQSSCFVSASSVATYFVYRANPFALLSGTLRTYQKAACDEEWINLRCPIGTTISVQLAQYGRIAPSPALCTNPLISSSSGQYPTQILLDNASQQQQRPNFTCLLPSAIQTVVGLCQKKTSCKFQTSPRTFGADPCPGIRKYVEVAFKCRPSEFKSVIGCENEVVQLKCNRSSRLAIYAANFGRTEYESVQCPQPKGVPEETCLSSFATETVMQMCHGKRKCALGVEPVTFGSPCKRESLMYLKVIHTCVPRKVLKEKYQGEPEPDELFEEDEDSEGNDTGLDSVLEQPSIYSPDHTKSWPNLIPPKTTQKSPSILHASINQQPGIKGRDPSIRVDTLNPHEGVESAAVLDDGKRGWSKTVTTKEDDGHSKRNNKNIFMKGEDETKIKGSESILVPFIGQGIEAYHFISRNSEKFYLYVAISIASGLLMLVILLMLKIWIGKRRNEGITGDSRDRDDSTNTGTTAIIPKCTSIKPSSSSVDPSTCGISDIDELSLVLHPHQDIVDLHSVLHRSNTNAEELFPLSSTSTSTLRRPNEGVVRFSNVTSRLSNVDEIDINPRSLNPNRSSTSNIQFYYG